MEALHQYALHFAPAVAAGVVLCTLDTIPDAANDEFERDVLSPAAGVKNTHLSRPIFRACDVEEFADI